MQASPTLQSVHVWGGGVYDDWGGGDSTKASKSGLKIFLGGTQEEGGASYFTFFQIWSQNFFFFWAGGVGTKGGGHIIFFFFFFIIINIASEYFTIHGEGSSRSLCP